VGVVPAGHGGVEEITSKTKGGPEIATAAWAYMKFLGLTKLKSGDGGGVGGRHGPLKMGHINFLGNMKKRGKRVALL